MYTCTHVYVSVYMYVRTRVCMYACMDACMHACLPACLSVCLYVFPHFMKYADNLDVLMVQGPFLGLEVLRDVQTRKKRDAHSPHIAEVEINGAVSGACLRFMLVALACPCLCLSGSSRVQQLAQET